MLVMLNALELIGLFKAKEQRDKSGTNHSSSKKAFRANQKVIAKTLRENIILAILEEIKENTLHVGFARELTI